MRFEELEISGTWLIEPRNESDRRGYFTRRFCRWELESHGLDPVLVKCRITVWPTAKAVAHPVMWSVESGGAEFIRCAAGAVRLALADFRDPRVQSTEEIELDVASRRSIYVPAGVAYRYVTLVDTTEVLVQSSELKEPPRLERVESGWW